MSKTVKTDEHPVVLDCGSFQSRVGYAGDDAPQCVFPTVLGREKYPSIPQEKTYFVGNSAMFKRGMLDLKYPIEDGRVTSWVDIELIWEFAFAELGVDPSLHPTLMTETSCGTRIDNEISTEIMFERLHVPAMYLTSQSILSLYSSGRTTGLVINSGHSNTSVVPVCDGYSVPFNTVMNIGGQHVTDYLAQLLTHRGYTLTTSSEKKAVRAIKEHFAYAALDYHTECQSCSASADLFRRSYELPDGATVECDQERFTCVEALFQPHLLNLRDSLEAPALHRVAYSCIAQCDTDLRSSLCRNIILSGGNSMFSGMGARMTHELHSLAPTNAIVKVVTLPNAQYAAWVGGSILASLSTFQSMWITKAEYEESGKCIVHRKCG